MTNIVILHGWGHDKSFWSNLENNLGEANITILDLPGFGNEPLISKDWGIPEYAEWVSKKITQLEINNVVLIGHSFGGRISALVASHHPEWLDALVLYGAPCLYRPTTKVKYRIRLAKILKKIGLKAKLNQNPELKQADQSGLGQIFRKVVTFDQTSTLPLIDVPTLLVWGRNDQEVPLRIAEEMNRLIPKSQLVILDNLGHSAHLENPYLFYGTIKQFIQSL